MKFDYNDINLIPKKCVVESRSECDTSVQFGPNTFNMPVIPANMSSVINTEVATKLATKGYFYIMHRFLTPKQQIEFVSNMKSAGLIASISVGVKEADYTLLFNLREARLIPDYITIDIAHGHANTVKKMIEYIKSIMPTVFIIAGNVSTTEAVADLQRWGADAVKVGIAPGHACTTAFMTGFGSRNCQGSTVYECARRANIPIIADGGIVYPADIAKAVVLGATMVMCGSLVSGCTDSPGELKFINNEYVKEYWGSASEHESGKSNRIEGTMKLIPYKNKTVLEQMYYLKECLQSAISYGGGNTLEALSYVQWY